MSLSHEPFPRQVFHSPYRRLPRQPLDPWRGPFSGFVLAWLKGHSEGFRRPAGIFYRGVGRLRGTSPLRRVLQGGGLWFD